MLAPGPREFLMSSSPSGTDPVAHKHAGHGSQRAPNARDLVGRQIRIAIQQLDPRVVISAVPIELNVVGDPRNAVDLVYANDSRGRSWRLAVATSMQDDPDLQRALGAHVDIPAATIPIDGVDWWLLRDPEGVDLIDRLAGLQRPLDLPTAIEWLEPIVQAVCAIHSAGYVCLRLSPWTIRYTSTGAIWLTNVPGVYSRAVGLRRGPIIPGFSAPELYRPTATTRPDATSDVFSLGAIAWLLLTGRGVPITPSGGYCAALRLRDIQPQLPIRLGQLIDDCLREHRPRRPESAASFLQQLRQIADEVRTERENPQLALRCSVAAETHVGVVKRRISPVNQDAVIAVASDDAQLGLLVVADGVSTASYGSGDLASSILASRMVSFGAVAMRSQSPSGSSLGEVELRTAINEANREIVDRVNQRYGPFHSEPSDVMGTTCVAALIGGGLLTVAAAGDSRAYLLRDKRIERLTRDHNLATLAILDGVQPDTARRQPHADALARCLGVYAFAADGTLVPSPVELDCIVVPLRSGDRLLLCTDGVTDFIGESEDDTDALIANMLGSGELPDLVALEVMLEANRRGGGDNIGVAVAFIDFEVRDPIAWANESPV
jgi:serine/threonine protein phosphatase PrpC